MLSFTRAHNGVVCCICNHPRGANLPDVAIFKNSKCNVLKLSTFPAGVLLPFCNLFPKLDRLLFTVFGGAVPPQFEKHGQRSEHTGFLTVHKLFCFASCLHYEIAGGVGGGQPPPPHLQNMDEDQNTYIFLHPSDGCVLQCVLRCV